MFHWRSVGGAEVDLILKINGRLIPMEIKLSRSPDKSMTRGLWSFMKDVKFSGYVLYPGQDAYSLGNGIEALPLIPFLEEPEAVLER